MTPTPWWVATRLSVGAGVAAVAMVTALLWPSTVAEGEPVPEPSPGQVGEPATNDQEVQNPEIQEPELQDPEIQDPELQDPELVDLETQDSEPDDPESQQDEIQDPEIQQDEIQDLEIQDPEVDDPDPDGFTCPPGSVLDTVVIFQPGGQGDDVPILACVLLE